MILGDPRILPADYFLQENSIFSKSLRPKSPLPYRVNTRRLNTSSITSKSIRTISMSLEITHTFSHSEFPLPPHFRITQNPSRSKSKNHSLNIRIGEHFLQK
ncbi:hypothetical protein QL285_022325 [Trifolium repens]|nr:hypothetical protein QL285_022325 [Trifolium repens]